MEKTPLYTLSVVSNSDAYGDLDSARREAHEIALESPGEVIHIYLLVGDDEVLVETVTA